jgi:succinyl-CoA synthetase alpha subunit
MPILVDESTTILVQGITGREASLFVPQSIEYGARIAAGVSPGREGQCVAGVPVYDSVAKALEHSPEINASIVAVPPLAALDAVLEAIDHGIALITIMTERIPQRDVARMVAQSERRGTRIIGPNSLGVICPGVTRLGNLGGTAENTRMSFTPGPVGVLSRSGGLTCEIASLLSRSGIGQSACVSVGGDPMVGSTFADLFRLFVEDEATRAVVLLCEPGGRMEEEFGEMYAAHGPTKPVAAFVAGQFVESMPGTRFGHASVIVQGGRGSARDKIELLRAAGVLVADRFSHLPGLLKESLSNGHVH